MAIHWCFMQSLSVLALFAAASLHSSAECTKLGEDVRVRDAPRGSSRPSLAWTGTEYGVAWNDDRDGGETWYIPKVYFARQDEPILFGGFSGPGPADDCWDLKWGSQGPQDPCTTGADGPGLPAARAVAGEVKSNLVAHRGEGQWDRRTSGALGLHGQADVTGSTTAEA